MRWLNLVNTFMDGAVSSKGQVRVTACPMLWWLPSLEWVPLRHAHVSSNFNSSSCCTALILRNDSGCKFAAVNDFLLDQFLGVLPLNVVIKELEAWFEVISRTEQNVSKVTFIVNEIVEVASEFILLFWRHGFDRVLQVFPGTTDSIDDGRRINRASSRFGLCLHFQFTECHF